MIKSCPIKRSNGKNLFSYFFCFPWKNKWETIYLSIYFEWKLVFDLNIKNILWTWYFTVVVVVVVIPLSKNDLSFMINIFFLKKGNKLQSFFYDVWFAVKWFLVFKNLSSGYFIYSYNIWDFRFSLWNILRNWRWGGGNFTTDNLWKDKSETFLEWQKDLRNSRHVHSENSTDFPTLRMAIPRKTSVTIISRITYEMDVNISSTSH